VKDKDSEISGVDFDERIRRESEPLVLLRDKDNSVVSCTTTPDRRRREFKTTGL
jgi:hypothetical protein